jgi:hypothetical protein
VGGESVSSRARGASRACRAERVAATRASGAAGENKKKKLHGTGLPQPTTAPACVLYCVLGIYIYNIIYYILYYIYYILYTVETAII